jgi:hypothetical protein
VAPDETACAVLVPLPPDETLLVEVLLDPPLE